MAVQDYLAGLQYGSPGGGVGVNADKLDPEFANRMAALIQAAEAATGDKVSIFEGYRDPARSAQLRANYKGTPVSYGGQTYSPQPGVKGYRASAPGVSEHNIGMAADIRAGKNPDKYPSGPAYDYMVKHAAEYGLRWFGNSDPAHFEIPPAEYKLAKSGTPLKPFQFPASSQTALAAINAAVPPPAPPQMAEAYAATTKAPNKAPVPMPGRPPALISAPQAPVPMPGRPAPLSDDGSLVDKLPPTAMYGLQRRLTAGQATQPPADFTTATLGDVDPRTLGMMAPPVLPRGLSVAGSALPPISKLGLPVAGGAAGLAAPVPMPGRPAALTVAPPALSAPPAVAPAAQRSLPPQAAPSVPMVQLASGKMIAPGIYNQGDHSVSITDDGSGRAKITRVSGPMAIPGVIDPLREANADTVAGGYIRSMIPKIATDAVSNLNAPAAIDNVKSAAVNAASNLGSSLGGFGSGIGSAFSGLGGLFGGRVPSAAVGYPTQAQLQAIRAVPRSAYYPMPPLPMPRPANFYMRPPSLTHGTAIAGRAINPLQIGVSVAAPVIDPLQLAVRQAQSAGETYDRSRDPSFNPNGGAHGGSLAGF